MHKIECAVVLCVQAKFNAFQTNPGVCWAEAGGSESKGDGEVEAVAACGGAWGRSVEGGNTIMISNI